MIIIDSHIHLDDNNFVNVDDAVRCISTELQNSNITKGIILHLLNQNWPIENISKSLKKYDNVESFINVNPFKKESKQILEYAIKNLGFIGLKLHPRLQKFKPNESSVVELVKFAGELNVPILIDAFPDGEYLYSGITTNSFFELAKLCPKSKIIIAHFGGHHCIDFMMLAKRTDNVFFDFSFSFLYYYNSSVITDILYCMHSMKYDRIFYGSDYPDRGIKETLEKSLAIFEINNIEKQNIEKLFHSNWDNLFK